MEKIGYIAIVIALFASLYSVFAFILGARSKSARIMDSARNSLISVAVLVSLAVFILAYAIFTHNFSLEYVASYTSLNTSTFYLLSALWAGNSGSLLFWAWILSIFTLIVILTKRRQEKELVPWAAMVLMANQAFILILMIAITNPFNSLSVVPPDGNGLNPMLQNLGMVFHPPALLAGYVGFAVPFAFAVASLILGKTGEEWLHATRKWMLAAWLLLGIGNIIGMWWAYVELGWGGYWAWDPVENAGLMPWLVATALLHSSIMQRRRGGFKVWNLFLMILTYSLVMFGTFLTRSGLLSSVHTYEDKGMTPYFIVFIGIALIGSLGLLYYRNEDLKKNGNEALISRESSFLLNNILFVLAALIVLLGTVVPSLWGYITGAKMVFGASAFNKINGPLFLVIILLAGICTVIGWKKSSLNQLFWKIIWPLIAAVIAAIVAFILGVNAPMALLGDFICALVLFIVIKEFINGAKVRHKVIGAGYFKTLATLVGSNSQRYGGYIVHAGIVVMAIGIIGSSFFHVETEKTLKVGDSINIKQYSLTYNGLRSQDTPDKSIVIADLSVYSSGRLIDQMVSKKYFQKSMNQSVTEVGIRSNLREDLYVILQGWDTSGTSADFKVMVNPLVIWIWIGGGLFLLGGLITFWPSRRRNSEALSEISSNI